MDYELMFWVAAPFVLGFGILLHGLLKDWAERYNQDWEREHCDDFNKD